MLTVIQIKVYCPLQSWAFPSQDFVGLLDWNCEELKTKMALGKRRGSSVNCVKCENEDLRLGFVRYRRTFSFGRKRIVVSNDMEVNSTIATPIAKKQCSERSPEYSPLESQPQDILIRILCGVDHNDLKQLFHVSKTIREATLIAKQWHFEYSTPKKSLAFRNSISSETDTFDFDDVEAPNAPKQSRFNRSRVTGKKLADISVALFASPDKERWPRKELFMEVETEI